MADYTWTHFWTWARANELSTKGQVEQRIGRPIDGLMPHDVRQLLHETGVPLEEQSALVIHADRPVSRTRLDPAPSATLIQRGGSGQAPEPALSGVDWVAPLDAVQHKD